MVAHPPCFAAGTLVLTKDGHKPISEVIVGDLVLTHKGRWRRVTEVMHKTTDRVTIVKSSNCLETITTSEHPYYARYREPYRNGFRTLAERDNSPPDFVEAGKLTLRHFTGSVLPPVRQAELSDDDLWLMGRYVADGHMRESRWTPGKYEEMVISVGRAKLETFKSKVSRKVTFHDSETAIKATFYGHDAIAPFAQFGRGAANKAFPEWVLALPAEQAAVFLDGYLSGDGYICEKNITATSVSAKLVLGVAVLMQRAFGKCPAFRTAAPRDNVQIEGRCVQTQPLHTVEVPRSCERLRNYVDGDYAWGHVRYVTEKLERTVVYNLSVEEDETYTANGVVVHNCTALCNSGVRWLHEPPPGKTLKQMWDRLDEGASLFSDFWNAPIDRICVENPVMHKHAKERIRNYQEFAQSVQPWQFGHPETKRTCFWLKNLPPLVPTDIVEGRENRVHRMPPGPDRWKERSRFFSGISAAMAAQWGELGRFSPDAPPALGGPQMELAL
nr:Hint domain-containing protein [Roseicella sp. DB1501]